MKLGTVSRWVHAGHVVELYDLASGAYLCELPITEGKAKVTPPPGVGIIVKDVAKPYTRVERVSA